MMQRAGKDPVAREQVGESKAGEGARERAEEGAAMEKAGSVHEANDEIRMRNDEFLIP
jgi:hypothetical protein